MPSLTSSVSCLVIEDDKFKADSVCIQLRHVLGETLEIVTCGDLSSARAALEKKRFDIAIIDMSIPSHPALVGAGSPYSFPTGGLDVLFEIEYLGHQTCCIFLTQYPEIEIEGALIGLEFAPEKIWEKFEIRIAGCIQYYENEDGWKHEIEKILQIL